MKHSFLLIGQSNMAGRGRMEEAIEVNKDKIFLLKNGCWQKMFRPINPDRGFAGVSLAERFAECYSEKYGVDVGLICCADGGTSLDKWKKGSLLFDNAVFNAKLAMRTSSLAGILWHQGEADCTPPLFETYEERFIKFYNDLREALGLWDIPFLAGGLGDFLPECTGWELKYYNFVNDALIKAVDKLDMAGFVSAKGLTAKADNLHFNSASLYEFGERYFCEYEKFEGKIKLKEATETEKEKSEMEKL